MNKASHSRHCAQSGARSLSERFLRQSKVLLLLCVMLIPQLAWALSGSGTSSSPYLIYNASDLTSFRTIVNGSNSAACAKLMNNITLSGTWTPMGVNGHTYSGTFNGQNYTISGLSMNVTGWEEGLFGWIQGATIQNLTVSGQMTSTTTNGSCRESIGGVVGLARGVNTITNVHSKVNITMNHNNFMGVGGVVGKVQEDYGFSTITGCSYSGTLTLNSNIGYVGGIVGNVTQGATITDCNFTGTITTCNGCDYIGGIVGFFHRGDYTVTISNCTNSGAMTLGNGSGIGGIFGHAGGNLNILNNTFASGATIQTLTASTACGFVGGIAGKTDGTILIQECTSAGSINVGASYDCIAGIVGYCQDNSKLTIKSCLYSGHISNTSTNSSINRVAGIIAYATDNGNNFGGIKGCLCSGSFSTPSSNTIKPGAIASALYNNALDRMTDNYYRSDMATAVVFHYSGGHSIPSSNYSRTTAQISSGSVAYELYNGSIDGHTSWRQNIGTDNNPVLDTTHGLVYRNSHNNCSGTFVEYIYTNNNQNVTDAHAWGNASWSWGNDGKSATCKRTCTNNSSHTSSKSVTLGNGITSAVLTAATCTTQGTTRYTATATVEGTLYTSTKDVTDIPLSGHTYTGSWSWNGSTPTLKLTCTRNSSHTVTLTTSGTNKITVTSSTTTQPTCTTKGYTTYSASVTYNNQNFTDSKTIQDVDALGHSWGNASWTWTNDGKSATCKRTCSRDASHTSSVTATTTNGMITSAVKTAATCTAMGTTTYTAKATVEGTQYTSNKDVVDIAIDPNAHNMVNGECTHCHMRQSVTYRVPTYNTPGTPKSGIASWNENAKAQNVRPVSTSSNQVYWGTAGQDTWYYVSGNVRLSRGVICNGNVHLILCDGATLTATASGFYENAGIKVSGNGNTLTIYAQSDGANMGTLTATGDNKAAGIGGFASAMGQNITINGGAITATGGNYAAGIGGGYNNDGKYITINAGTVAATGGDNAAGIGGGGGDNREGNYITINGGTVTATGGTDAAGIGGGKYYYASNIFISTALVTQAGSSANPTTVISNDGTDMSWPAELFRKNRYVIIHGTHIYGTPTWSWADDGSEATATFPCSYGDNNSFSLNSTTDPAVSITSSTTATCTSAGTTTYKTSVTFGTTTYNAPAKEVATNALGHAFDENGACTRTGCTARQVSYRVPTYNTIDMPTSGIASWNESATAEAYPVPVSTTTVTWGTAGQDSWYYVSGNVTLTNGAVCQGNVHLILCDNAKLTVTNSNNNQAGINVTDDNSLTIYAQSEGSGMGELVVSGGYRGAGIGGGKGGDGHNITIHGGTVTATGAYEGAGIGGGDSGICMYITITGGTVTAIGGEYGAGIGGGACFDYRYSGVCSYITIIGGTVTAIGGEHGAGIGGGYDSSAGSWGASSNIFISTALVTKAGSSENPTTVIPNNGSDLGSALQGVAYRYVTIHQHNYANGVCTLCREEEPATLVTADNYTTLGLTAAHVGYYAIGSAGQLYWWKQNKYSESAVLTADINVATAEWYSFNILTGKVFDGNNHCIQGLNSTSATGFVEYNHGTIKNLGLKSSSLTFVGKELAALCTTSEGSIINCYVDGAVLECYSDIGDTYVSGICSRNYGTIRNCYAVNLNITGTATCQDIDEEGIINTREANKYFAGICGYKVNGSTITNCYTTYSTAIGDNAGTNSHVATKTAAQFASGEVAWLLNGSVDAQGNWTAGTGTPTWYQKLSGEGVNTTPVLMIADDGSNTVYGGYDGCEATTMSYTNDTSNTLHATSGHVFADDDPGHTFCTACRHTFFRYTASSRVTPYKIDRLKNASGQGIYVDSQNTFDELTKEGVIEFNEPLTQIGEYAFYICSGFTGNLIIPNSVTSIGSEAFYNCSGLTGNLIIPNSVTSIGKSAFYKCTGFMGNLTIGSSVKSIGTSAFYECSGFTGNLIIPNSVTSIGSEAFYNCSGLTGNLIIPNSVTSIGSEAFYNCSGLKGTLTIGSSLTRIENRTFKNCNFSGTLDIPATVTYIGNNGLLFGSESSVTDVIVHWDTPLSISQESIRMNGCTLHVPGPSYSAYKAATYWKNFPSIVCIEHNLTSAEDQPSCTHGTLNYQMCTYCSTKSNIVESGTSLGGHIMDSTHSICTREGCGHGFFHYNTATDVIAPYSPSALKDADGNSLEIISNSVTNGVGEIEFNKPLVTIGHNAFFQCEFTGDLVVPSTVKTIEKAAFSWVKMLNGTLTLPQALETVQQSAFCYTSTSLQSLVFRSIPACQDGFKWDCVASMKVDLTDQSYMYTGDNTEFLQKDKTSTYTRTGIKNQWGTIVLPFDVTIDSNSQPYDFYTLQEVTGSKLVLQLVEGTLSAGTPALVRMSEAARNAETGKYDLTVTAANKLLNTTVTPQEGTITLTGGYGVTEITNENGYIISNNRFWNIQKVKGSNKVYNAPFRAYLKGALPSNAPQLDLSWDDDEDEATTLEDLFSSPDDTEETIFDLNGRRLSRMQKGINIVKRGNKTFRILVK